MPSLTLLDVINAVGEHAATAEELQAVVTHLVNSGKVRLCGEFAGWKIEFGPAPTRGPGAGARRAPLQDALDQTARGRSGQVGSSAVAG